MAVLRPLKLVIENWPPGQVVEVEAVNNPEDPAAGTRKLPFSGELWIEQDDFREQPPKGYHRLAPGGEVRLRYGWIVKCTGVVKDPATGQVIELRASYDPDTPSGSGKAGRKVKGIIHWVSAAHAVTAEVRLYDHLFRNADPDADMAGGDELAGALNPGSLEVLRHCYVEPSLGQAEPGDKFQFERLGYFCADPDGKPGQPVFNRTVTLRDTWAKIEKKGAQQP